MTFFQPHCTRFVRTHTTAARKSLDKRRRLLFENLEQRLLLSTLDISGGTLTYAASSASSLGIGIGITGTDVTFYDYPQSITIGTGATSLGWTGSGNFVSGPLSSFSSITVTSSSTDGQSLTIDFDNGNPIPAGGITFEPTAATGSFANFLGLSDGSFLSEASAPSGPTAGTITYSDTNTTFPISYSNVNRISDLVTSPSFIFTAPAGSNTINLTNEGSLTYELTDGGTGAFQSSELSNKASITLNANVAGVTTTVDISTISTGLTNLFINSGAGGDTVNVGATPASLHTFVDIGSAAGSTINLGNGSIADLFGPLHVQSTGGANALIIDDAADPATHIYNLAGSQFSASSLSHSIDISDGFASFSIAGSQANNIFNFTGTAPAGLTTFNISGGVGNNTLNLTSASPTLDFSTPGAMTFGAGQPTLRYSSLDVINISKPALAPIGAGTSISGTENESLTNAVVASFTQSDLGAAAADFSATINWGDSSASFGIISSDGNGNFDVLGSHAYAATGNYTLSVSLTDAINHGSTSISGTTINITDTGPVHPLTNPISSSATVAHGAMLLSVFPLLGTAGLTIPAGEIASFFQTGGPEYASDYAATITIVDAAGNTILSRSATVTADTAASEYVISAPALTVPGAGTYHALISLVDSPSGDSVSGSALALIVTGAQQAAAHLAFAQGPSTTVAGKKINPAITINTLDANGNLVTSGKTRVTLTILSGPAHGKILGKVTATTKNGVATFKNLSFHIAGDYTLAATASTGYSAAQSAQFTITPAAAKSIAFVTPPTTISHNDPFPLQLKLLDRFGNLVTQNSSNVSLKLRTPPANATLAGAVTHSFDNGLATFSNLSLNLVGSYSLQAVDATLKTSTHITAT